MALTAPSSTLTGQTIASSYDQLLFLDDASMHVGIRGPLYSRNDLINDEELGFKVVHCDEFQTEGVGHVIGRIKERVGNTPIYLSIVLCQCLNLLS